MVLNKIPRLITIKINAKITGPLTVTGTHFVTKKKQTRSPGILH